MLYLFAGQERSGDIAWQLREFSKVHGFHLQVDEWDILRDPSADLSSPQAWEGIFAKLESGYYDVLVISPPCGTYSRARHRTLGKGGPVPLRSRSYPWGFPWLSNANQAKVDTANFFVKQSLYAISLQIKASKFWLLEHPEDLGRTKSGEVPGSIWQLPELHDVVSQGGTTWAIHQCVFDAETSKPTRFASNLPALLHFTCAWPRFDPLGNYLGPLGSCPHGSHVPLVGFKDGRFLTSGAEAYPPLLCKHLAQAIVDSVVATSAGEVSVPSSAETFARKLLSTSVLQIADALALAWLLPREDVHKATQATQGGAFYAGAFLRGGLYGLRATCGTHHFAVQCFTRLLRANFPNLAFSSFGIFFNVLTAMHRDSRNAPFPNLLLALSKFTGGEVWQEEPGGTTLRSVHGALTAGVLLDVARSPQVLQAHQRFHCTEPWSGDRVVLVGFSVDYSGLQHSDVCQLLELGFVLVPTPADGGDLSEPHHPFPPPPPVISSGAQSSKVDDVGQAASALQCTGFQVKGPGAPGAQVKSGSGAPGQAPGSRQSSSTAARQVYAPQVPCSGSQVEGSGAPGAQVKPGQVPSVRTEGCSSVRAPSSSQSEVKVQEISSEEDAEGDDAFDPWSSRCSGPPIRCRHSVDNPEFVDGFGLCSPGRWRPLQRGRLCSEVELEHARALQGLLRDFVIAELPDPRRAAFELASGRLKVSPFSQASLDTLRGKLASLLPDPSLALERTEGQPFWLHLLHQSLVILGDPDAAILVDGESSFAEGVPLGDEVPIPRAPQVFRKRINFRSLDITDFEPDMANYSSAELSSAQLEEQFRKDELAGLNPVLLGSFRG